MKNNRYPDGYMPKIDFWQTKLLKATTPHEEQQAISRLEYFVSKQNEVYGTSYKVADFLPTDQPQKVVLVAKRTTTLSHVVMPCDGEVTFRFKKPNWDSVGWNSVYCREGENVTDRVLERLQELNSCLDDLEVDSLRINSREEYNALLRATYMD